MDSRTLELNIASAKDLKDVNLIGKMDVYAVVSLSGDTHCHYKTKTPVHRDAGTNPTWNFPITFTINETHARQNRLTLQIKLLCQRTLAADKEIGHLIVPVKDLIDQTGDGKSFQHVSYQVRRKSGKPKGAFSFSYKFGGKLATPVKHAAEPVMAYPPPVAGSSGSAPYPGGYPPSAPQYNAGYIYPPSAPPAAYGVYPPQAQAGYGYPGQGGYGYTQPPPVQKPGGNRNKFGMGLGAGLLGGALGGMLIGEMMSDGGGYDSGYDDGFGDASGGFDF